MMVGGGPRSPPSSLKAHGRKDIVTDSYWRALAAESLAKLDLGGCGIPPGRNQQGHPAVKDGNYRNVVSRRSCSRSKVKVATAFYFKTKDESSSHGKKKIDASEVVRDGSNAADVPFCPSLAPNEPSLGDVVCAQPREINAIDQHATSLSNFEDDLSVIGEGYVQAAHDFVPVQDAHDSAAAAPMVGLQAPDQSLEQAKRLNRAGINIGLVSMGPDCQQLSERASQIPDVLANPDLAVSSGLNWADQMECVEALQAHMVKEMQQEPDQLMQRSGVAAVRDLHLLPSSGCEQESNCCDQLQVCDAVDVEFSISDSAELNGIYVMNCEDCLERDNAGAFSCRCVNSTTPAASDHHTTGLCTPTVCAFVPKTTAVVSVQTTAGFQPAPDHTTSQITPKAFGDRTPGLFAWRKPSYTQLDYVHKEDVLDKDGLSLILNEVKVDENIAKLECALVGKLLGRRIPFALLHRELSKKWSYVGEFKLITIAPMCFICIFQNVEARDTILRGGPWMVTGNIIGLDRWSLFFSLDQMNGLSSPIWIRFPKLPLMYWDPSNLARMAAMVGNPLWMDEQTNTWGQNLYARVCVRIVLSQKLPSGFWINGRSGRFFQRIEYEGLSQICFHCGHIGHNVKNCHTISQQASTTTHPPPALHTATPPPPSEKQQARLSTPTQPDDINTVPHSGYCQPQHEGSSSHSNEGYGPWTLVTKKVMHKSKVPSSGRPQRDDVKKIGNPTQIVFSAQKDKPLEVSSYRALDLTKQHHRISQAHFTKELQLLGPIASSP